MRFPRIESDRETILQKGHWSHHGSQAEHESMTSEYQHHTETHKHNSDL